MSAQTQLNNKWLKASVLGCLWASSEIVLGSFFHNLQIPFSSALLAAIGIILLVSISHFWKETGLFWRAGLICAMMKSISPSAIIFGPMIAIFSEALLMEFAVRVFRRNAFSYILGGMLAMTWPLFHKIINYIILYGYNIIELYENLTKFAQKQLNIQFENLWLPILFLWVLYLIFGILSAMIGIYIGRKAVNQSLIKKDIQKNAVVKEVKSRLSAAGFNHSLLWFALDISGMVTVLCLMNFCTWHWWIPASLVAITVWILRYRQALRPLKKPKFWVLFFFLTMLTSFVFAKVRTDMNGVLDGLMVGIQMNFRAAVMITGFSSIGTELCNPVIRNLFTRSAFRQLPMALEVAFDTLPFAIANLPRLSEIFKRPLSIIQQLVSQADFWLERVTQKLKKNDNVIIITGDQGQGKTTFLQQLADYLKSEKIKVGGIVSPVVRDTNHRLGYDLVDISTGTRIKLSLKEGDPSMTKAGPFYFFADGLEFGRKALAPENNSQSQVLAIDEIGPLELDNGGWAQSLDSIMSNFNRPVILIIRKYLVEKVVERWSISNPLIIDIAETNFNDAARNVSEFIKLYRLHP